MRITLLYIGMYYTILTVLIFTIEGPFCGYISGQITGYAPLRYNDIAYAYKQTLNYVL